MTGIIKTAAVFIIFLIISCTTTGKLQNMHEDLTTIDDFFMDRGFPLYESTLPEMYYTGVEWRERAIELVQEAEDYILISVFLGNYHDSTSSLWELLPRKIEEGVRVYCIIDAASWFQVVPGTSEVVPAAFKYLRDAGVPVVEYNPFSISNLFFTPLQLDRDHRKFWVIDGKYLAAGGMNINLTSYGYPPETGNIDAMAEVISPGSTRQVVKSFVDTWNAYSPEKLNADDFNIVPDIPENRETTDLWLLDHLWRGSCQVTDMFDAFVVSAEEELWFIQGYSFLNPALIRRISFAAERGVSVNFVISDYARTGNYKRATHYGLLDLIDAGADVYLYTSPIGAFLHYKLIMADRKTAAVGSVNYNLRSQTLSREISFIFRDYRVGEDIAEHIKKLEKNMRKITREEAEEHRTLKNYLSHLFMQFWG